MNFPSGEKAGERCSSRGCCVIAVGREVSFPVDGSMAVTWTSLLPLATP